MMDSVTTPGGGRVGMVPCPGRGGLSRGLGGDVDAMREWGAVAVATLMETAELERYAAAVIGREVRARGLEWWHLPVRDMGVPGAAFEDAWAEAGASLRGHLRAGRRIVLHCLGGLGRTGTITARLLVELGTPPDEAIDAVRAARPGAIETREQEAHVRAALVPDPNPGAAE